MFFNVELNLAETWEGLGTRLVHVHRLKESVLDMNNNGRSSHNYNSCLQIMTSQNRLSYYLCTCKYTHFAHSVIDVGVQNIVDCDDYSTQN